MSTREPASTAERGSISVLRIAVYVVALILAGAVLSVTAVSAQTAETGEPVPDAVVVNLDEEGDAVVAVTIPFDLTVAEEQINFEAFVENEQRRQTQVDQYGSRLDRVATEISSETDREMDVTGPNIETRTVRGGETGLVVLSATWQSLAADTGDRLVLGSPFDSGFNTDQTLVVRPPEGYQVASSTPPPDNTTEQLVWNEDQPLGSFELVVEPQDNNGNNNNGNNNNGNNNGSDDGETDNGGSDDGGTDNGGSDDGETDNGGGDDSGTGDDASGPGFGIPVMVVAVGTAVLRLGTRN